VAAGFDQGHFALSAAVHGLGAPWAEQTAFQRGVAFSWVESGATVWE
jgi:hypothetical protein